MFPFPIVMLRSTPTLSYRTNATDNTDASTYTFAAADIGTAASDRYVVVGFAARNQATITSITVGGIAATLVKLQGNTDVAALYIAAVPTGATADIVVTLPGTALRAGIGVWALYGLSASGAAEATAASTAATADLSLTVTAGAIVIGQAYNDAGLSFAWVGLTENFDAQLEASNSYSGASVVAAGGALTITATMGGAGNHAAVSAAFK